MSLSSLSLRYAEHDETWSLRPARRDLELELRCRRCGAEASRQVPPHAGRWTLLRATYASLVDLERKPCSAVIGDRDSGTVRLR